MMSETQKKEYPPSPMHKHFDEVVWEEITVEGPQDNRVMRYRKWLFTQENFHCGICHQAGENIQFMVLPTGVYMSCKDDGITQKVPSITEDEEAIMLENRIIGNEEAIEVTKRNGTFDAYFVGVGGTDAKINIPETKIPRRQKKVRKKATA